jgi:ribosome-binding factor A
MDSRRQLKVSNLLQEVFSQLLITQIKPYLLGAFATLTHVRVTSDLSLARFNISIMGYENKQEVIDNLKLHVNEIRKILGNNMRHDLRKIPELEFYLDETLDYVDNINHLFDKIKEEEQQKFKDA